MNRITINGVTIEYPETLTLSVEDSFVVLRHKSSKTTVVLPADDGVIAPPRLPKPQPPAPIPPEAWGTETRGPTKKYASQLPANAEKLVIQHLRKNSGRAFATSIGFMINAKIGKTLNSATRTELKNLLHGLVREGTLVDLRDSKANGGQPLYALKSMMANTVETNDDDDTPPTRDYSEGIVNDAEQIRQSD